MEGLVRFSGDSGSLGCHSGAGGLSLTLGRVLQDPGWAGEQTTKTLQSTQRTSAFSLPGSLPLKPKSLHLEENLSDFTQMAFGPQGCSLGAGPHSWKAAGGIPHWVSLGAVTFGFSEMVLQLKEGPVQGRYPTAGSEPCTGPCFQLRSSLCRGRWSTGHSFDIWKLLKNREVGHCKD